MAEGPHVELHLLGKEGSGMLGGSVWIQSLLSPEQGLSLASLEAWQLHVPGV